MVGHGPSMTRSGVQILLLVALCALAAPLRADVLVHKDGRRIEGVILSEAGGKIRIDTGMGTLEFARAEIVSIERGKTRAQQYAERKALCKTAEDLYQLGTWARDQKLSREARTCMLEAVELDPDHAGAQQFLGRVPYKGEWMTPEERDARQKADEEAEMRARGLVRHAGSDGSVSWVTPEEKAHLDKGEVFVDGAWIPFEAAQRRRGLELFEGAWYPRSEALARTNAAVVEALAGVKLERVLTDDALVCGPQSAEELLAVAEGLKKGRAWFEEVFQAPAGLELFGGRRAELYMFTQNDAYTGTVDHFASLTTTVPPGWTEAVKKTHGFLWWDPYPLSSARQWKRPVEDLPGHCYHNWGHLLLNRLNYDGRLLPPWFDEGVAGVLEFRVHARNAVFCRGSKSPAPAGPDTGGGKAPRGRDTKAGKAARGTDAVAPFDPNAVRAGQWRAALVAGLGQVPAFDELASLQFDEMEPADIAASMAVVEWLGSRGSGALRRFHDVLRKTAPPSPTRVLPNSLLREAVYEEAFQSASGMGWKAADEAWRQWITTK